jgi:hypothetical protein
VLGGRAQGGAHQRARQLLGLRGRVPTQGEVVAGGWGRGGAHRVREHRTACDNLHTPRGVRHATAPQVGAPLGLRPAGQQVAAQAKDLMQPTPCIAGQLGPAAEQPACNVTQGAAGAACAARSDAARARGSAAPVLARCAPHASAHTRARTHTHTPHTHTTCACVNTPLRRPGRQVRAAARGSGRRAWCDAPGAAGQRRHAGVPHGVL